MKTNQPWKTGTPVFNLLPSCLLSKTSSKILSSIAFLMLLSFQTYGQDESWTLLKEESGVKVYYQIAPCDEAVDAVAPVGDPTQNHQHLKLKIENSNSSNIGVEWDQEIKTTDNEGLIDITVDSGQTVIEECSMAPHVRLTVTSSDNYPTSFKEFLELVRITIKP